MRRNLKILHVVTIISIIIISIRYKTIYAGFIFLYSFITSLFQFGFETFVVVDFSLIDILISIILIIYLPIISLVKRNKIGILRIESSLLSISLIIILFSFVFAPLITNRNPNFQKDLLITKLLPPFSEVKILHLKYNNELDKENRLRKLNNQKGVIAKQSFNEYIIIADSIRIDENVIYFRKNISHEIDSSLCLREDNQIKISSFTFLFGSDEFGRDIFTRVIYGARTSIFVGLCSLIVILGLGICLGFIAGLRGGLINVILTRITEMFFYIPNIFLVILVLALFGNSLITVIIVLGFTGWMSLYKIVKSEVVAIKSKDFIISSRKIGLSDKRLLFTEVLPLIAPPVLVSVIIQFAYIVLAESALSFLGLGAGIEYPSWGAMIQSGQEYLYQAWWMLIVPGSILVALLFSINELGQRVKVFLNPRVQKND